MERETFRSEKGISLANLKQFTPGCTLVDYRACHEAWKHEATSIRFENQDHVTPSMGPEEPGTREIPVVLCPMQLDGYNCRNVKTKHSKQQKPFSSIHRQHGRAEEVLAAFPPVASAGPGDNRLQWQ